jgi:hypothetical protein
MDKKLLKNGIQAKKVVAKTIKITVKYADMPFEKRLKSIGTIVAKNKLFLIILGLASLLRLYRLPEYAMFLSDQGRDAIIIKRIVTGEHFPAIGAPTSIGQAFLGPFYYYLIAPFLLFFNFNPSGLAYGVAIYSIIGLIILYIILKKEFDLKTSLIFLVFVGFSSVNIDQSRFSWNPNLLPLFSFFCLYFFYKTIVTKQWMWAVLWGSFLSFCIQLHYLGILLTIPIAITFLGYLFKSKNRMSYFVLFLIFLLSFIVFFLPLIIFDIRHDYLNIKNLFNILFVQKIAENSSHSINTIITSFMNYSKIPIYAFISIILVTLFNTNTIKIVRKNIFILSLYFFNIVSFLILFSFMRAETHPHYFGQIYFSLYFICAFFLAELWNKKSLNILFVIGILFLFIFNNYQTYYFHKEPNNQIQHTKTVAEALAKKIKNKPFNIATWPVSFSEDNYLYFLELKNMVPASREKKEITNQMFILCNEQPCLVLDSPSWNISIFGKAKIDTIETVDGVMIYRLIHDK